MTRPDALSARQEAILRAIGDWIAETGESPSVRQIGERVGLSSASSVAYQLGRLEARGLISRTGHRWRSCRLST
ncbi:MULTISPECIES: MarR family transcriptional regulator [unclassified Streptomyces]|uniref:LexA family protein n=1 Tax=unclassified Streptomyces TaxID=2593676 RepID=UPI003392A40D